MYILYAAYILHSSRESLCEVRKNPRYFWSTQVNLIAFNKRDDFKRARPDACSNFKVKRSSTKPTKQFLFKTNKI